MNLQDRFIKIRESIVPCFDQQRSLPLVKEMVKRNEGGFCQKISAGYIAAWHLLAKILSILGNFGVWLAYPLTFLLTPLILVYSLWFWIRPLHRDAEHLAKEVAALANSVFYWWFYRIRDAMKECRDGVLLLDDNLVPAGIQYDGWELKGYSTEKKPNHKNICRWIKKALV